MVHPGVAGRVAGCHVWVPADRHQVVGLGRARERAPHDLGGRDIAGLLAVVGHLIHTHHCYVSHVILQLWLLLKGRQHATDEQEYRPCPEVYVENMRSHYLSNGIGAKAYDHCDVQRE